MITNPKRFLFSRFLIGLLLLAFTIVFYQPVNFPSFAKGDVLGWFNTFIVIVLLVLTVRHFFYLFFSVCEEIRRAQLPSDFKFHPVSIIVPAYNESVLIANTIKALKSLDYPHFEVIIVDDQSSDNTIEVAAKAMGDDPRFRILTKKNGGKASALNLGIKNSKHDYIFCMDADSELDSQALKFGIRHFADQEVVAVAGAVLVLNQKNALTKFQAVEYITGLNFYKSGQSFLGLVTIIPGPSGLFKKSIVEAVGYYETDTFAEDCDLTLKLIGAGGKIVYEPFMEVRTEIPEEALPLIKQRYRWNRGILQAIKKNLKKNYRTLLQPHRLLIIGYMTVEAFILPVINVLITIGALVYQFAMSDFSLFSFWLFVLVFLDLAVLIVTLVDKRWPLNLIWYTILSRFTYGLFHDVVRILSTAEEFFGIGMNWGKLERTGSK